VVIEAASIAEAELGAFLRRKGLHEAQLQEWRQRLLASLSERGPGPSKAVRAEARRIRQLEQELARKEKALAEAAALLVLKKKAQEIWGDEAGPTGGKSGSGS
jgi:transposase-like protein